jgi:hypothetical protein
MSASAWMAHASGMAREVGPHTGCHLCLDCRSATHEGGSRQEREKLLHAHASTERDGVAGGRQQR